MPHRLRLSPEDKEQLFYNELLKSGVEYQAAIRVAKLIASAHPDTSLSAEDHELMTQACQQWLNWHKRRQKISHLLRQTVEQQPNQAHSPLH